MKKQSIAQQNIKRIIFLVLSIYVFTISELVIASEIVSLQKKDMQQLKTEGEILLIGKNKKDDLEKLIIKVFPASEEKTSSEDMKIERHYRSGRLDEEWIRDSGKYSRIRLQIYEKNKRYEHRFYDLEQYRNDFKGSSFSLVVPYDQTGIFLREKGGWFSGWGFDVSALPFAQPVVTKINVNPLERSLTLNGNVLIVDVENNAKKDIIGLSKDRTVFSFVREYQDNKVHSFALVLSRANNLNKVIISRYNEDLGGSNSSEFNIVEDPTITMRQDDQMSSKEIVVYPEESRSIEGGYLQYKEEINRAIKREEFPSLFYHVYNEENSLYLLKGKRDRVKNDVIEIKRVSKKWYSLTITRTYLNKKTEVLSKLLPDSVDFLIIEDGSGGQNGVSIDYFDENSKHRVRCTINYNKSGRKIEVIDVKKIAPPIITWKRAAIAAGTSTATYGAHRWLGSWLQQKN